MSVESIRQAIRDVKDFPQKGIVFKDITPVLKSEKLFKEVVDIIAGRYEKKKPDYLAAIESRGFIFGSAIAYKLGCGIIPVRKKGKLPYKTIEESYALEYGTATIELHEDAIRKGDEVVIIDDLLATGGTAGAAARLIERLGGKVTGLEFVIELAFLKGRTNLPGHLVNSIIVVD
ncbi:MAG TPA: adenine phosphoribosyltransferase [Lentisphaeria bacterium]|nr:MAG: adenine phosphoribosyltransferase [Lentisphaerae bacterium GWF2_50_93]HCE46393.1 adenine phosphoribosyltransferase [Lentisphaeria bacterium]